MLRIALIISAMALTSVAFQNCGGDVPQGNNAVNQFSVSSPESFGVNMVPSSVKVNEPSTLQITGGVPPFTVSIIQGTGAVVDNLTILPSAAGLVVVQVEDMSGFINQVSLSVLSATPVEPPPPPPPAPFVPEYRPATENCRGPRNSTCSVSIDIDKYFPELVGKVVPNLELNVRHFNGRSDGTPCFGSNPTLALASGTAVSQTDGGGDKQRLLTALYNETTRTLQLTSITSGWGSCGGNPCNSCISNVMIKPMPQ